VREKYSVDIENFTYNKVTTLDVKILFILLAITAVIIISFIVFIFGISAPLAEAHLLHSSPNAAHMSAVHGALPQGASHTPKLLGRWCFTW